MNPDSISTNFFLIGIAEFAVLLIAICVILLFQIRSKKRLIARLRARLQTVVAEKNSRPASPSAPEKTPEPEKKPAYKDFLKTQLALTKTYHQNMPGAQDIALDIDLEIPLNRRAAAVRYAFLIAERESLAGTGAGDTQPNWQTLENKYQQLFDYYADYSKSTDQTHHQEALDLLNKDLISAKKRINNLEKFKTLYFELEEKWKAGQDNADQNYVQLLDIAPLVDDPEAYEQTLNNYHQSFEPVGKLIDAGIKEEEALPEASHSELRHLRSVAADQQKIIAELQSKLESSKDSAPDKETIRALQHQLNQQMGFINESETCIRLMEEELLNANQLAEKLDSKVLLIPRLEAELKDILEKNEEFDNMNYSLKTENQRLVSKLRAASNTQPGDKDDTDDIDDYKQALTEMQGRYAELEEKYLDLKTH